MLRRKNALKVVSESIANELHESLSDTDMDLAHTLQQRLNALARLFCEGDLVRLT